MCVSGERGGGPAPEIENKLRIEKIKWKHEFLIPVQWCCGTGTDSLILGFIEVFTLDQDPYHGLGLAS